MNPTNPLRPTPEQLAEWRRLCEQRQYCPEHNPDGVVDAPLAPECGGCWSDDELLGIALALLTEVERLREAAEIGLQFAEAWIADHSLDEHPSPKKAAERMAEILGVPNWREKDVELD